MKWYWIVLIVVGSMGIVYLGIRYKNVAIVLSGLLAGAVGFIVHLFKKKDEMKEELERKDRELSKQKDAVKVFEESTKKVGKIKTASQAEVYAGEQKIEEAKTDEKPINKSISVGNDVIDSFNNRVQDNSAK